MTLARFDDRPAVSRRLIVAMFILAVSFWGTILFGFWLIVG